MNQCIKDLAQEWIIWLCYTLFLHPPYHLHKFVWYSSPRLSMINLSSPIGNHMNNLITYTYTDLNKNKSSQLALAWNNCKLFNPQIEEMWYLYCHLPWSCRYKCLMCLIVWRAEHVSLSTCSHILASVSNFLRFLSLFYHLFITFYHLFYHVYHVFFFFTTFVFIIYVFKILSKLIPTNLEANIVLSIGIGIWQIDMFPTGVQPRFKRILIYSANDEWCAKFSHRFHQNRFVKISMVTCKIINAAGPPQGSVGSGCWELSMSHLERSCHWRRIFHHSKSTQKRKICLFRMVKKYGCFQKKGWFPPNHPHFNRVFHEKNHPFWVFCPFFFGNIHI